MKVQKNPLKHYISHYRLEKELGEGGMGKVYLAFDERLERAVALKCLKQGKNSTDYQLRLRQESKLLAKLNHPAIVQIYDLVEHDSDLILVIEYVPGSNLKTWLQQQAPDIEQLINIAVNITEGLRAAHRVDVIHRDLKLENILVNHEGKVKITDFGIAKSLAPQESIQTQDGIVLGSHGAMSPEQILNQPLDQRCDLFALGLLMFQMLTGKHAFGDPKSDTDFAYQTLYGEAQLSDLPENTPKPLVDLIRQLLEKSPGARLANASVVLDILQRIANTHLAPGTAAQTTQKYAITTVPRRLIGQLRIAPTKTAKITFAVMMLTTMAIGGSLLVKGSSLFNTRPLYAVVLRPQLDDRGDSHQHTLLDTAVQSAVMNGILSLKNVALINPDEIRPYPGSPAEIALAAGADILITSTLRCVKIRCDVQLTYTNPKDRSVVSQRSFPVRIDRYITMQQSIMGQTQGLLNNFVVKNETTNLNISEKGYRDYLSLVDANKHHEVNDPAIEQLLQLQARWPHFSPIYDLLTRYYLDAFLGSNNHQYLTSALNILNKALQLSTDTIPLLQNKVKISLKLKDYESVLSNLERLSELGADEVGILALEAEYWQKQGKNQQALKAIESAIVLRKSSGLLYRKASILWVTGSIDGARKALNEAISLNPNYLPALALLADSALMQGNAEEAIEHYLRLNKLQTNSLNTNNLGLSYYLLKKFDLAKVYFLKAHNASPTKAVYLLNLADSEWLSGNKEQARQYYEQVLVLLDEQPEAGSEHFTVKAQALAHLERNEEALISLKKALTINAESLDTLFAAALVYALIGETTSSIVHMKLAIKQGISPKWFSVPWFDSLQQNPTFPLATRH